MQNGVSTVIILSTIRRNQSHLDPDVEPCLQLIIPRDPSLLSWLVASINWNWSLSSTEFGHWGWHLFEKCSSTWSKYNSLLEVLHGAITKLEKHTFLCIITKTFFEVARVIGVQRLQGSKLIGCISSSRDPYWKRA